MAGITTIITAGGLTEKSSELKEILNSLNYLASYYSETLLLNDNIFIGWNKYDEYPIFNFETEDFLFVIEGKIYNQSNSFLEKELPKIFQSASDDLRKNWLLKVDGDFIIYAYNKKTKSLNVLNDLLGRLPVYYKKINDQLIISRYIKFITSFENQTVFDKTGLGEYLIFGYLLGERTLFKDIKQLRPSSFITYTNSKFTNESVYTFNFENRQNSNKTSKEMVNDLHDLFSNACVNRVSNGKQNLLALTGGMDSRIIAACLAKNNIVFKTTTMIFKNEAEKEEATIAKEISQLLNADWNPSYIYPPSGKDVYTLLKLKEGMNYLATSFLLPFYKQITERYGNNINLITGDKGDKTTLSYDNPIPKCSNLNDLMNYILGEHGMVSLDEVTQLIDVHKDDILNDLSNLLNSYPEKDFAQKYSHYRGIEKSHKLAFQGEDRHRRFFWTYEPITSSPFVHYFFNCPDKAKKMHKLFTPLLESFSQEAAGVVYTNFKSPINSIRAKLFMAAVYYIYPKFSNKLRTDIKRLFFGGNPLISGESIFFKSIEQQLHNSEQIKDYFKINDSLQLKNYRHILLQSFFSLTSLIDDAYADKSILEQNLDEVFDHMK